MTAKEIKANLNRTVVHTKSNTKYRLIGATIRRDEISGKWWYQAELQDLAQLNAVRICRLEDIEIVGGKP